MRAFASLPLPIVSPNDFVGLLLEIEPENVTVWLVGAGATLGDGDGVGEGVVVVPPPTPPANLV